MLAVQEKPYVPVYRVCTVMRVQRRTIEIVPAVAEDVCYAPKELKRLAARVVGKSNYDNDLNEDLKALIEEEKKPEEMEFYVKDRSCPTLQNGGMKVGEFKMFPEFDSKVCAGMFTVDLLKHSRRVLEFLRRCDETEGLFGQKSLQRACTERYPAFMKLQSRHKNKILVPPIDVAIVMWTHMLQSKEYRKFAQEFGLHEMPHSVVLEPEVWKEREKETKELYGEELYDFVPEEEGDSKLRRKMLVNDNYCGIEAKDARIQSSKKSYGPAPVPSRRKLSMEVNLDGFNVAKVPQVTNVQELSSLARIVFDDALWYKNFVKAMGDNFDDVNFEKCLVGYQKYLYLLCKHPRRMEFIGFAPNPAIDLMWHSHLSCPLNYWRDVSFLMGVKEGEGLPMHKLLPEEARTPFVFEKHLSSETRLWEEEFPDDPMKSYVKHNPPRIPSPSRRLPSPLNNNN